jgi:hypothetical protein
MAPARQGMMRLAACLPESNSTEASRQDSVMMWFNGSLLLLFALVMSLGASCHFIHPRQQGTEVWDQTLQKRPLKRDTPTNTSTFCAMHV